MKMDHDHDVKPVKIDININVDWDKATDSAQTVIWTAAFAVVLASWFMKR